MGIAQPRPAPDRNLALDLLRVIEAAKGSSVNDVTVCILDRPRHDDLVADVRAAGARIQFISDDDVAGALMASSPDSGVDLLLGIGGTPEGVIAACAACAGHGGRDPQGGLR